MAPDIQEAHDLLHSFMYEHVYHNPIAKARRSKAKILIEELYRYFRAHPEKMPELYQGIARKRTWTGRSAITYPA